MSIRIFRKAIGLLIVDIVIIIGIFVLQFRTDSSIIEKIGNMQVTLEKLEDQQDTISFKNKFQASYNGLTLYGDDQHPVQIISADSKTRKNVQLVDFKKVSNSSCKFIFTDDVSFVVSLSSDSPTATLSTTAYLPSGVSDICVPYNYSYNMKVQRDDGNRIILDSKKSSWEISAFNLSGNYLNMNTHNLTAAYSVYEATVKFTFDAILDLEIAKAEAYENTVSHLKNNLIAAFKANNSETSITEQNVISYIAAMAENNEYTQAIEDIPQSFKKGKQRTYVSAPYLNTLENMNVLLNKEVLEIKKTIADAAYADSLEVFNSKNLAARICMSESPKNTARILERAAATEIENLTVSQATGILLTYVELSELRPEFAQMLTPVIEKCIQLITDSCNFDGSVLSISANDTFLSVLQAVETGVSVMRYGLLTGDSTLVKAGRVIVNSYISESSSFDLRTLSLLYPIIAYDNPYYPHYQQIKKDDDTFIWAWTCAKDITYEKDEEGSTSLSIDFPEGLTHYVIFKGIPQFTTIYIYNMAFRTDPRFETYNSSGYVYKADEDTLLLKSRHKSRIEVVKLEYDEELAKRRAEEAERAAEEKARAEAADVEIDSSVTGMTPEQPSPNPTVTTPPATSTNTETAPATPNTNTVPGTDGSSQNNSSSQNQYQQRYQYQYQQQYQQQYMNR